MIDILRTECKKIHLFPLLLTILIPPLFANAFGVINFLSNRAVLTHGWQSLWTQVSLFYFTFFFIPLIALTTTHLWRCEHRAGFHFLQTLPVQPQKFIHAKALIAWGLITITQGYFFFCFYICGRLFCGFNALDTSVYLTYIFLSILFSIPVIYGFSALSIQYQSLGIILLSSVLFTVIGFMLVAQNIVPFIDALSQLNQLALMMNQFHLPSQKEFLQCFIFALLETALFFNLSKKAFSRK